MHLVQDGGAGDEMNRFIVVMGCGFLAACGPLQQNGGNSAAPVETTADLLKQVSPKVCSQQDVRDTISNMIKPKIAPDNFLNNDDIQVAMSKLSFSYDAITLASVDRTVSSVSCDATLTLHNGGGSQDFSIHFVVRPSVEDPALFVVSADLGAAKTIAINTVREEAGQAALHRSQAAQAAQASAEPTPEPTPSATATPENIMPSDTKDSVTENRM
jgi:hypothetical protein